MTLSKSSFRKGDGQNFQQILEHLLQPSPVLGTPGAITFMQGSHSRQIQAASAYTSFIKSKGFYKKIQNIAVTINKAKKKL